MNKSRDGFRVHAGIAIDVHMVSLTESIQSVRATFCNEYVDTYFPESGNQLLPK